MKTSLKPFALIAVCMLLGSFGLQAAPSPDQIDFFEKKIRPVLVEHCYKCHSQTEGKSRGGLTVDTKQGVLQGGDTGPSVDGNDPNKSLLIKAMRYESDDLEMPPKQKLPANVISDFEQWVRMGAPDPRDGPVVTKSPSEVAKDHWGFRPISNPAVPAASKPSWEKTPIDRFITRKMTEKGIEPSEMADKRTMVRRATYDLLGMPPTMPEFDGFMKDNSPKAYEQLIDRLLESPHYGERWGRHWLDVARYSDTKGDVNNRNSDGRFPYAWTYRDYVINSMNADKPYDVFIKEQLAADLLPTKNDPKTLAALGFITVGKRFNGDRNEIIDDRIDVVSKGFLGLTVVCARCHDHKFDPIPTGDYYSWHGIFNSVRELGDYDDMPLIEPIKKGREYNDFLTKKREIELEKEQMQYEREFDMKKDAREKVASYLYATWEVNNQMGTNTVNRFIFVNQKGLNNGFFDRWRRYLGSKKDDDPTWGPWKKLAKLKRFEFATKGAALLDEVSANKGEKYNPLVARSIRGNRPQNHGDLANIYGVLLGEADRQYQKVALAAAKTKREPRPLEPNLDVFKRVMHGGKDAKGREERFAPAAPTGREMYNMFDLGFRGRLQRKENEIVTLMMEHEAAPVRAMVVQDSNPRNSKIFIRGNARNQGEEVPRRFLQALVDGKPKPFKIGSGRLELANSIASRDNPLTARVIVNRVWMHHFGEGIVRTPSDFGTRADEPSHPELLDFLATWFMDNGWSLKKLHKAIMMSAVYQQKSEDDPRRGQIDPNNDLVWRQNVRRLEFEALRDTILSIGGTLDLEVGGKAVNLMENPFPTRRTVYGYIDRGNLASVFRTFDFANPDLSTGQRYMTTVPQQALFLMNNPLVVEQARNLVQRGDFLGRVNPQQKVELLYRLIYQRAPSTKEVALAMKYLGLQGNIEMQAAYEQPWKYGYGVYDPRTRRLVSFKEFTEFREEPPMWGGGPRYAILTPDGGHPAGTAQYVVTRRFTAQADGQAEITGDLRHQDSRGDGVLGLVYSSARGVLGQWTVHNRTQSARIPRLQLKKGDTLDFIVHCGRVPGADAFTWAPQVRMTSVANMAQLGNKETPVWNARTDFSGPNNAVEARPLVAWEKFAQVLLLTNELTFYN